MKLDFNQNPSGIAPAIDPEKLAENMATTAENVRFDDGRIVPVKQNSVEDNTLASGTQEIYQHKYEIFYNTCDTDVVLANFTGGPLLDGEFVISIDDVEFEVTGIDFTADVDQDDLAETIQIALRAETGKYETVVWSTDHFIITAYGYISVLSSVSGGVGTDISGAGYIDGAANGTLTQGEDTTEWVTYLEKKDIVPSPLTNDQYTRLYMTDSDGQINVRGLMGDRDLKLPIPEPITSVVSGKLMALDATNLYWWGGTGSGAIDCGVPVSVELLNDGHAVLIFQFPGYAGSISDSWCADGPTLRMLVTGATYIPTAAQSCSTNIVSATPTTLTYGGTDWGSFDVVSATGTYADYLDDTYIVQTSFIYTNLGGLVTDTTIDLGTSLSDRFLGGELILVESEEILLGTRSYYGGAFDRFINCVRAQNGTSVAAHNNPAPVSLVDDPQRTYESCDITVTVNLHSGFPRERNSYYLLTYIDDIGQESPVSEVSALTTAVGDEYNTITMPAASPTNIVSRRIYRTALLGDGAVWQKVADVDIATNTYDDFIPDRGLGISLGPYGNPPIGLDFLVMHPCGSLIGAKGRSIYASAPLLPYAWPVDYNWVVGSDVTGLAVQANDIIILTKGHPNIITGSNPDNFAREELQINQSCVSRHSICKLGQSVFYASPDGIVEISGASAQLVSEGVFSKDDWTAFTPTGFIAEVFDKKLFFFHATGGFQFQNGVVTTFDDVIVNLFHDTEDDALYVLKADAPNDIIYNWQTTSARELTWASKDFLFQHPVTWSDAQIIAESYSNITLNLYANNALVSAYTVLDEEAFKLPMLRPDKRWRFELVTNSAIDEWQVGTNGLELRS